MMFLKLWFTYPTARQEDPPAKCYAEVEIINRISANSYDIVQSSRTFTLDNCLKTVPIISRLSV